MRGPMIGLLGLGLLAGTAQAQESDIARRFGALEGVTQVSLSPDGQKLAFLAPSKGQANDLYIVDVADGAAPRRILRSSGDPEILLWCKWATDVRLICEMGGREDVGGYIMGFTSLLGVDATGGNVKTLSTRRGSNAIGYDFRGGDVIDWQPGTAESVLVMRSYVPEVSATSVIRKDAEGMGVDLVKISDGSTKLVEKPRVDAIEYITDGGGKVRIMGLHATNRGTGYVSPIVSHLFRRQGSRDWEQLSSYDIASGMGFYPYAIDTATDRAIGFAKVDGRRAVVAVSLDGAAKPESLYRHPQVDMS
ncbi:MAG: S9 family peptidase, partial [Sphingopyxis sp.]|nr:S9 family peptidase [Sphingopyxis sp.]